MEILLHAPPLPVQPFHGCIALPVKDFGRWKKQAHPAFECNRRYRFGFRLRALLAERQIPRFEIGAHSAPEQPVHEYARDGRAGGPGQNGIGIAMPPPKRVKTE